MFSISRVSLDRIPSGKFLPFEEARSFMRKQGLTSWNEWREWRVSSAKTSHIPTRPDVVYRDSFVSTPDFLGYPPMRRAKQENLNLVPSLESVINKRSSEKSVELRERFLDYAK